MVAPTIIGTISNDVFSKLEIAPSSDANIYIGASNIAHMKKRHPKDYAKYFCKIRDILSHPDYIGKNPTDNSIEYVKEYAIDGEFVKVAVRIASSGKYYARSLYVLNNNRVSNFISKGTLRAI